MHTNSAFNIVKRDHINDFPEISFQKDFYAIENRAFKIEDHYFPVSLIQVFYQFPLNYYLTCNGCTHS